MRDLCFLALLLAAGCSSAPTSDSEGSQQSALRRVLFDWTPAPSPEALAALRARVARHESGPCRAARLLVEPDVAHALFVFSGDPAERAQAADAFMTRGEALYGASERARAASPARHDEARRRLVLAAAGFAADPPASARHADAASEAFEALGDRLLAREAQFTAWAARVQGAVETEALGPVPAPLCRIQAASAAWLALGPEVRSGRTLATPRFRLAFEVAAREDHWLALRRLEAMRSLGAARPGDALAVAVSLQLARSALRRDAWLPAVRHALAARRQATGSAHVEARLLLSRAYLGQGQPDTALAEAQGALDAAQDLGQARLEARAGGLLGQALSRVSRAEGAATAFERAAAAARRGGDEAALLRYGLNRANALLKAGQLARAESVLKTLSPAPPGRDQAELRARRSVTQTLLLLISRRLRPADAARRVEAAVAEARASGAFEVAETYAGLVERLRSRGPRRG